MEQTLGRLAPSAWRQEDPFVDDYDVMSINMLRKIGLGGKISTISALQINKNIHRNFI
jgi:hypothetical protein